MSRTAAGQRMALVRARLTLPTVRRAAGLFEGAHTSILTGKGHDFEDLTEYSPGDEVRDIDWKVSARAGQPIIRRFERDTDVFTQLVIDTGVEMLAVTPSGESKAEVALACAETLAYLGAQRGDRLGLVFGNSAGVQRYPARHGLTHLDFILDRAEYAYVEASAPADVSAIVEFFLRTRRERSLVLLITDQFWPSAQDESLLRRIRERHELLVVRIDDMPLTQEGIEAMADIAGDVFLPEYVREDKVLRELVFQERHEREKMASRLLESYRVLNASLGSSEAVVPVIVELLRGQHHAR